MGECNNFMDVSEKTALKLFLSDFHLGNYFAKEKEIIKFLNHFRYTNTEIFLLGDVFDLWRNVCFSKYRGFFDGLNVWYVVGNHDYEIEFASAFSSRITSFVKIHKKNVEIVAIHGHEIDKEVSFLNPILGAFEHIFYSFSTWINIDLREKCVPIMTLYHNFKGYYPSLVKKYSDANILVLGHTHNPGQFVVDGVKIFNLGSWLTDPRCFAILGDRYSFFNPLHFSSVKELQFEDF